VGKQGERGMMGVEQKRNWKKWPHRNRRSTKVHAAEKSDKRRTQNHPLQHLIR
jgi:hypothetical protein